MTAYKPCLLPVQADGQIEIKTPGVYMFQKKEAGTWLIHATDPTQKQTRLSFAINGEEVNIDVPATSPRGKTIQIIHHTL